MIYELYLFFNVVCCCWFMIDCWYVMMYKNDFIYYCYMKINWYC